VSATLGDLTLRAATEQDVDAMFALDLECFDEPFRFDLAFMRRLVRSLRTVVLVAEAAEGLAGFVILERRVRLGRRAAYVASLDVAVAWRRKGVARHLLETAERVLAAEGARSTCLHVFAGNRGAIDFYEREGFLREGLVPDFYGVGLDGIGYAREMAAV
jgi:ribosomal-protein-alanine N-acetyltransferase